MEAAAPRRGSANVSASALDHWRSHSPTGSERRKLSYHPTDSWDLPVPTPPNGAPAESPAPQPSISTTTRVLQVAIAVLYCLLAAGPVFGFAAIKPVLVHEGVYRDQCTPEEVKDKVWVCYGQELRLNLMFTVAAVSTNVCALPVGTVLDRFGPKIASLVGVVLLTLGALLMALAQDLPFDAYIPGYLFLALGGPFVFISSFQLSNTFPAHSGLILALLTGAFDTSSAVFLVYRLIYQQTDSWFTPKKFFLIYLIVPALILLAQLFIMPSESYKTAGEASADVDTSTEREDTEATGLLKKTNGPDAKAQDSTVTRSGVWGALHGRTALQQIVTPWFILIALFTLLQMTRINYFVATLRTQYTHLLHSHESAIQLNNFFDVALPLGGVAAVPLIGLVLDHTSTTFVLALLVGIATTIGILGIVPEMWAGYANIILFVLYRPLYYTAVSDYSAKVFGFETFGKVYGLIICLAGLFNFSQQGLDALTHGVLKGDPVPVNVGLLVAAFVVGVVLVGFVWRKSYTMQRDKLEEEAEEAREVEMPRDLDGNA